MTDLGKNRAEGKTFAIESPNPNEAIHTIAAVSAQIKSKLRKIVMPMMSAMSKKRGRTRVDRGMLISLPNVRAPQKAEAK